jgi:zinc transport system substrate-binding protein
MAILGVVALALSALTACSSDANSPASSTTTEKKPVVIAGIYPLQYLAEQLVGSLADVQGVIPPGVEPHEYELTPSQVAAVQSADLVVYQSGVAATLDAAVAGLDASKVIDTATLVTGLPAVDDGHDHGHSDEADHDHEDGDDHEDEADHDHEDEADHDHEDGDDHDHEEGIDPHTWLSPANMKVFAAAFATRLAEILPQQAAAIQSSATTLTTSLTDLDTAYRTGLASCERHDFLTAHRAFAYLAHEYGLEQLAVAGISPEDEPSPAHLAEVSELAKSLGLTTVFFEPLTSRDAVAQLAADLGLEVAILDPIEAITDESPGTNYLEIMQANLNALQLANGCRG